MFFLFSKKKKKEGKREKLEQAFGVAGLCWATDEYRGGRDWLYTMVTAGDGGVVDVAQSPLSLVIALLSSQPSPPPVFLILLSSSSLSVRLFAADCNKPQRYTKTGDDRENT